MKTNPLLFLFGFLFIIISCSKKIDYTSEYMKQTSGRYIYNQDEVIDVFYENKNLYISWKGIEKIKPVIIDENTFFIADMYKKLHFVQHSETKKRYLSIVSEEDENLISYDYLKVEDSFKTPSMHFKDEEYEKALEGYLEIQKQDSTSIYINERDFNSLGYELLRKKKYEDAIGAFKINVALYPESDNVYDSLADAYLRNGDSLQAFDNFKMALKYNTGNKKAKRFIKAYNKSNTSL